MKNKSRIAFFIILVMLVSVMPMSSPNKVSAGTKITYALQSATKESEAVEKISLGVNESIDMKFFGAPSNWKSLFKGWVSLDETVCKVDSAGVITGLKAGTTFVYVNLGADYVGFLQVTVLEKVTDSKVAQITEKQFVFSAGTKNITKETAEKLIPGHRQHCG